jgi:hypothetical protein
MSRPRYDEERARKNLLARERQHRHGFTIALVDAYRGEMAKLRGYLENPDRLSMSDLAELSKWVQHLQPKGKRGRPEGDGAPTLASEAERIIRARVDQRRLQDRRDRGKGRSQKGLKDRAVDDEHKRLTRQLHPGAQLISVEDLKENYFSKRRKKIEQE